MECWKHTTMKDNCYSWKVFTSPAISATQILTQLKIHFNYLKFVYTKQPHRDNPSSIFHSNHKQFHPYTITSWWIVKVIKSAVNDTTEYGSSQCPGCNRLHNTRHHCRTTIVTGSKYIGSSILVQLDSIHLGRIAIGRASPSLYTRHHTVTAGSSFQVMGKLCRPSVLNACQVR